MSVACPLLPAATLALLLATAGSPLAFGAENPDNTLPQTKDSAGKIPLSDVVEKKLKIFEDKARTEKAKAWEARMQKEVDGIVNVTGLLQESRPALSAAARQAASAGLDDWAVKLDQTMRKELVPQPPAQAAQMLDQETSQVSSMADIDWQGDTAEPFDRPDWLQAVHQVLTAEQAAAWDAAVAKRKEAVEKEIADNLKNGTQRIKDQQTQEVLAQCNSIEITLGLPKDRADKLEALGKSVVDQTSELWRKRVERVFLSMEDDQRKEYARNGNIFIGTDESESPLLQPAWKDGVAGLLTSDEVAHLKAVAEARKDRRAQVMGEAMIMVLDEKIAFTEAQRQQLEPIANRLVKDVPQLFPDAGTEPYYSYAPAMFYGAATKATDAELKPILDDLQRDHWRHLMESEDPAADTAKESEKTDESSEPEDVEKCISTFLYQKTSAERKLTLTADLLKAEDAVRVAGLKSEPAARLQVAARGSAEESLSTWKWFTEQQIRSQLQELTPQNVKQRLDGLEDYIFQRNFGGQMNRPGASVWDDAVNTVLTAPQMEAWKKETDARAAFRDKAIAALIVAEFDRKNPITDDQRTKLEPVIAGVVKDYSPEISQVFSNFNGVPWYMGGGYTLMPFSGVPADDLKAILSKEQYDRWTKTPDYANSTNLWQVVNQVHNQRAQAKAREKKG